MPPPDRLARGWALFVVVAVTYTAGALAAWHVFDTGGSPVFFPPAGMTVAAMLLTDRRRWPAVLAAIVAAETLIDVLHGVDLTAVAGYALANAAQPLVGATLVRTRTGGAPDLRRRVDLGWFGLGAVLAGPLAGALIGATTIAATTAGTNWAVQVLQWWAGDAIGVLMIAPPILLWPTGRGLLRARRVETAAVLTAAAALPALAFQHLVPPSMLILPVLTWAAVRLGMLGAALTGAVVASTMAVVSATGAVLFTGFGATSGLGDIGITQAYAAFMLVVAILVAQEVYTRLEAMRHGRSERRERLRVETLASLARELSADLTPADIGRTAAATVMQTVGAQALTLGLVNHDRDRLEWVTMAGYPPEVSEQFAGGLALSEPTAATEVIRTGRPVILAEITSELARYPITSRWVTAMDVQSFVAWPLASAGRTVGILNLLWRDPQPLDTEQVAYVSAVASLVGQALVRARLYADENARAAVLQAAVLPDRPPGIPGLDIAVSYQPADAVHGLGGDWYDAIAVPSGTYIAVGDVVGHGLLSVEDMAQLRTAGRALALQGLSPARILAGLNDFVRRLTNGRFATVVVAILNPAATAVTYAHAGHPPSLLRRACDARVQILDDGWGPALGIGAGSTYDERRIDLEPGDLLVFYTDGLVESYERDIDTGIAAAQAIIARWDARVDLDRCCKYLSATLAPPPRSDDVCAVAVRTNRGEPG